MLHGVDKKENLIEIKEKFSWDKDKTNLVTRLEFITLKQAQY